MSEEHGEPLDKQVGVDIVSEFLEVIIHSILYIREIYPAGAFERRKKYEVPVQVEDRGPVDFAMSACEITLKRISVDFYDDKSNLVQQCCHPDVQAYVSSMLSSLRGLLMLGHVEAVSMVILSPERKPVERFTVELGSFLSLDTGGPDHLFLELERSLRACLLKVNTSDALLKPCPKDSSWTLHVHTKESDVLEHQAEQTINGFSWISPDNRELYLPESQLTPLKALDSPIIKLQLFVEETADKGSPT